MTDKNDDDVEFEDWVEEQTQEMDIPCLFSTDRRFATFEKLCESYQSEHNLNFTQILKSKDVYDRIRLVNWIRRRVALQKESVKSLFIHLNILIQFLKCLWSE